MLGALAGDIIGSVYEHRPAKERGFPLWTDSSTFTDDTVLTVAVGQALLDDRDYPAALRTFARRHPGRGYGPRFWAWATADDAGPTGSLGNGSAMRVSPVAYACDNLDDVLEEAARSARCTHDHPAGVRGAQAVALAVWLARRTRDKELIRCSLAERFGYDLSDTVEHLRPTVRFDATCPGSIPPALIAFLDGETVEDAVRNAVWLGGDADTQACIAAAVAEAYHGDLPAGWVEQIHRRLTADLRDSVTAFLRRYPTSRAAARFLALGP